jgi:hypothetical protein
MMLSGKTMRTQEAEVALANYLNIRQNLIVPNVHHGFGIHECDLLVVTKAGRLWEIEIKVNKYDLRNDEKKPHQHKHEKISRLYFAIPDYLQSEIDHIPERAGILIVNPKGKVNKFREATVIGKYKVTDQERYQLARLGALRIWNLKYTINLLLQRSKSLTENPIEYETISGNL